MRSLVLLAVAAAALHAPAAGAATAQTRSQTFEIVPSQAQAQPVSSDCAAGEQLIGGGYATASRDLRVISSYPRSSTSWTVVAWNPGKVSVPLQVHLRCLRGGEGQSTVVSVKGRPPSAQADCPNKTVAVAGGYLASWSPRGGGNAVTGSHPAAGNGWGVEAVRLPGDAGAADTQTVEVFAVCLGGASLSPFSPVQANVAAGSPSCLSVPNFAQQCTYPRTATQTLGCAEGEIFSSTGHQVTAGTLPSYSVLAAGGSEFTVNGLSRDESAMAVRLVPVCLTWASAEPLAPASLRWALPAGLGLLLLLLLLAVYLLRSRSKSKRDGGSGGLEVTVKSQRSAFRLDQLREVP